MTGTLAGAQTGLSDIPRRFINGLEEGETLVQLALDLAAQVSTSTGPERILPLQYVERLFFRHCRGSQTLWRNT
ncbi:MAG TPA: hypothetical protein VFS89_08895 [Nitrosospira sp.]|nr:hypothetical protein [Nitrosospira sp.]